MRIGLKPGVFSKRMRAFLEADLPFSGWVNFRDWVASSKFDLSINAHGWTIKAGARELTCEDGEVMGDPWLFFWLTGDVSRMLPQPEHDLSDFVDELGAVSLEMLR
jgi:hypothetical protein